jgi:hypothetical protein
VREDVEKEEEDRNETTHTYKQAGRPDEPKQANTNAIMHFTLAKVDKFEKGAGIGLTFFSYIKNKANTI